MTSTLRIGLAQLDTAWEDPAANIKRLDELLKEEKDLDLLVLPEMWSTGFTMNTTEITETATATADEADYAEGALRWMLNKAASARIHIAGSIAVKEGDHFYNRFYCVSPQGEIQQYDKKHLFSYGKEDHYYSPGHQQLTFKIGEWRIRAIVCYDLRFPVWCRNTDAYDIMVVVANWPEPRIHHWDALLRARAIENQSFVVGVNRIGRDGNHLVYNGHSTVYDMNGNPLLEMKSMEGIGRSVLDKESLTQFRQQYRFLQDQDKFSL